MGLLDKIRSAVSTKKKPVKEGEFLWIARTRAGSRRVPEFSAKADTINEFHEKLYEYIKEHNYPSLPYWKIYRRDNGFLVEADY